MEIKQDRKGKAREQEDRLDIAAVMNSLEMNRYRMDGTALAGGVFGIGTRGGMGFGLHASTARILMKELPCCRK